MSLWLTDKPEICITSSDLDECHDRLVDLVYEKFGDPEPILEYAGVPPGLPARFASPDYRLIGIDSSTTLKSCDVCKGGICKICYACLGHRNNRLLEVVNFPKNGDVSYAGRTNVVMYSKRLLDVLDVFSIEGVVVRAVESFFDTQNQFYEIIDFPSERTVEPVAIKDLRPYMQAWKCRECGRYDISYLLHDEYLHFVSNTVFSLNLGEVISVCGFLAVPSDKWNSVKRFLGTNNLSSVQLGVVDDALIDPDPDFSIR